MLKKLAEGIYLRGNQLEVDVPEILAFLGCEDTEENRDLCVKAAEKAFRESGLVKPDIPSSYTHVHRCLNCGRKFQHEGKRKKCRLPKETFCARCNS